MFTPLELLKNAVLFDKEEHNRKRNTLFII